MKLAEILLAIFIVLKLIHVIDWSWWIVTLPLTIPLGFSLVMLVICAIVQSSVSNDISKLGQILSRAAQK